MSRKALIVDDDPMVLKMHKRILEREGWEVSTAINPPAASYVIDGQDVVLSDWDMPHGGGARVIRECAAIGVPVVVISGSPPVGIRAQGTGKPGDCYAVIPKGCSTLTLTESLLCAIACKQAEAGGDLEKLLREDLLARVKGIR